MYISTTETDLKAVNYQITLTRIVAEKTICEYPKVSMALALIYIYIYIQPIDVHLKGLSAEKTFNPAYYNGAVPHPPFLARMGRWLPESKA